MESPVSSDTSQDPWVAGILSGETAYVGPEHVVVDLTNRCNMRCLACWTKSPLLRDKAPPEEWHRQTLPSELVIRLGQAFDADPDPDIPMPVKERKDLVGKISIRADDKTFCFTFYTIDDLFEIFSQEGFSPRYIYGFHEGEFLESTKAYLFLNLRWMHPGIAHDASGVAAVCNDYARKTYRSHGAGPLQSFAVSQET